MSKEAILKAVAARKTVETKVEGEPVLVKLHSVPAYKDHVAKYSRLSRSEQAAFLADQFIDPETGEKLFTPEFFQSAACPNAFAEELAQLWVKANLNQLGN